jgi:hypothetical protein
MGQSLRRLGIIPNLTDNDRCALSIVMAGHGHAMTTEYVAASEIWYKKQTGRRIQRIMWN